MLTSMIRIETILMRFPFPSLLMAQVAYPDNGYFAELTKLVRISQFRDG